MTCLALMACHALVTPPLATSHTSAVLCAVAAVMAPDDSSPPQAVTETVLAGGAVEAAVGMALSCLVRLEQAGGAVSCTGPINCVHYSSCYVWQDVARMTPSQAQLEGLEITFGAVCQAASFDDAFRAALAADENLPDRLASAVIELQPFRKPPSQAEDITVSSHLASAVDGLPFLNPQSAGLA
jgi:hypothetical protein